MKNKNYVAIYTKIFNSSMKLRYNKIVCDLWHIKKGVTSNDYSPNGILAAKTVNRKRLLCLF